MSNQTPAAGQSRSSSAAEVAANVVIGFVVSMAITAAIVPAYFDHAITHAENFGMTAVFAAASALRSYSLRRLFNWINTQKTHEKI